MNSMFYPKLALSNIKKNGKFYFPYLITFIGMAMMFYIMGAMAGNQGISKMVGAQSLTMIMDLGTIVVGVFAVIFLFYTNSFLMKRRQKEIGLYNILGMEKRHIAKILGIETLIIGVTGIFSGLLFGLALNKLMLMILSKLIGFKTPFQFEFSPRTMCYTVLLFGIVSALIFLWNIVKIQMANPIELLHGGEVGEKEPKTKWLMALVGIICIGIAYYIAITTESPLTALLLFFVAVILVIIGTYALFTAGSIVVLKMLRKNKKFYYHPKHFTSVSGMIYRMKQNAAGLANICILSTMVLVMVSTTTCLYLGSEEALRTMYPKDMILSETYESQNNEAKFDQLIKETLKENHLSMSDVMKYDKLSLSGTFKDGLFSSKPDISTDDVHQVEVFTKSEYERLSGTIENLADNEVMIYSTGVRPGNQLKILSSKMKVKKYLKSFPIESDMDSVVKNVDYVVIPDVNVAKDMMKYWKQQKLGYDLTFTYHKEFNLSGTDQEKIAFSKNLSKKIEHISKDNKMTAYARNRQVNKADFYATFGGFLFLGIFLGSLFLMATVLIIYYKQISEGYEDKHRFEIMQKVGMSQQEVKKTIGSQIVMVFFLPLLVAGIHVAAAFPLMKRLLALFSLKNDALFTGCTLGTIVVFGVVYVVVYTLTAKVYYKIVEWNE